MVSIWLLAQVVEFYYTLAYVGFVIEEVARRHIYPLILLLFHSSYRSAMSLTFHRFSRHIHSTIINVTQSQ